MASRRDELRAHQFLKQRAISALVVHQTDPEQPPFRRATVASYWGLALALLGLTVAGVLSFFHHSSSTSFANGKNVIVDNQGGVWVKLDGALHNVPNIASGLLAVGQNVPVQSVNVTDLANMKRGPAIGILRAPANLPGKSDLLHGEWTMCSYPTKNVLKKPVYQSVLMVGATPKKGTDARQLGVIVRAGTNGPEYLLWHGYRHQLSTPNADLAGLTLNSTYVASVSPAWLATVPAGKEIKPINVPGVGAPSNVLADEHVSSRVGQLFVATGDGAARQYYIIIGQRLRPITQFQALIQRAVPGERAAYGGAAPTFKHLDPDEATHAGSVLPEVKASDPPVTRPNFVTPPAQNVPVCAGFAPGSAVPHMIVDPMVPSGGATVGGSAGGVALADRVVVSPGHAALVRVVGNQDKQVAGTIALVTDDGRLFPLASSDVAQTLGYQGVVLVRVNGTLASRLPRGQVLDPAAARKPVG